MRLAGLNAFSDAMWAAVGRGPNGEPLTPPAPPAPDYSALFRAPPLSPAEQVQRRQVADAAVQHDAQRAERDAQFQQFIRDSAKRQLAAAEAAMRSDPLK